MRDFPLIKQLINHGFKDQTRTVALSGLDLFTSANLNGVGKSAVLEAFKLALMGEIPGRAKNVDDILQFTSHDEIKVEILADTERGPVNVERRFLRFAPRGEKRPVCVNGVSKKFEEGSQWVRQHVGAVSISFDPFEFLNLSDARKRQWIIAHSPESEGFGPTGLRAFLLARLVENILGRGIVHSLLPSAGANSLKEFCWQSDNKTLSRFQDCLTKVLHEQEPGLSALVLKALGAVFRYGSRSCSAEEGSNAMLKHLKSEMLRLKNAVRDQSAALSCMGPVSLKTDDVNKGRSISGCREDIQDLSQRVEGLDKRLEKIRNQTAAKIKRDERIVFLKKNISRLTEKKNADMGQALKNLLEQLHHKRVDPEDLQEKLKKLNRELSGFSSECRTRESALEQVASQLKLKRAKLETIGSSHFACPVASEIRCDTDMAPYRKILAEDIESLAREEKEVRQSHEMAGQKVTACQSAIDMADARLTDQLASNREIQREIDLVHEQIQQEEKETAEVCGKLMAHREELGALEKESVTLPKDTDQAADLKTEKSDLLKELAKKQATLDEWLGHQGKIEALDELERQKELWEQELGIVKQIFDLLSRVQEEMAASIAGALEAEVNDVLKLIGPDYLFTLNLEGRHFEMGWNREGKIIPIKTINSAHFIIFIVPFLTALIQRLNRTRNKIGLPTLKALCIEAESLTPDNLRALLRGLSDMKSRGVLDNALVAHYHSLRDPDKLSGFREHILENTKSPVKAGSL